MPSSLAVSPLLMPAARKYAGSAARRMSHARARQKPPPIAAPLTAAMTGWCIRRIVMMTSSSSCIDRSAIVGSVSPSMPGTRPGSSRSAPEQNARPAPVSTTTRTSLSALICSRVSRSGTITSKAIAFIRSGRSRVTSATASTGRSTRTKVMPGRSRGTQWSVLQADDAVATLLPSRREAPAVRGAHHLVVVPEPDQPHLVGAVRVGEHHRVGTGRACRRAVAIDVDDGQAHQVLGAAEDAERVAEERLDLGGRSDRAAEGGEVDARLGDENRVEGVEVAAVDDDGVAGDQVLDRDAIRGGVRTHAGDSRMAVSLAHA